MRGSIRAAPAGSQLDRHRTPAKWMATNVASRGSDGQEILHTPSIKGGRRASAEHMI